MTGASWLLAALLAGVALYAACVLWLLSVGRRQDARALAGFIPDCIVLFRRLLGDERVSRRGKALLVVTVGYLALPFDLVPDFIPVVGQLDDAIIVAAALRTVLRAGGAALIREHWPGPPASLDVLNRLVLGARPAPRKALRG